jgi:3-dehydroshikimate dehydratase
MVISACSDEISADLPIALDLLEREDIHHVDLRGVWGKNVIELSDEQAARAQEMLQTRGFTVTALSTPIGKTAITADFAFEETRLARALELARLFKAPHLRIFSFYASEAEAVQYRSEAIRRLRRLCELAEPYGVILAHENEEAGFCAWRPEECLAFHQELPSNFRALFEPCSFTVLGYNPYEDALPLLRPYIAYVHVRDTPSGTTHYTVVGDGDVGWRDILKDLKAHDYKGYLTLEPHLGWGQPETTDTMRATDFKRAASALRAALASI